MQIIGIDIGTTTISGAVLEYENEKTVKLLEAKTIENGGFMPTANEWEKIQDAGAIVKKAEKLLDDLLDKYPQTERIGLTGQMHGIVYIDQTGTCVSPLYTWQDGRGSLCEKGQCSLVQEIKEKCDLEAASGYGLVTHICNLKHGLVPERAVGFCTIMDYFGMCLTGRKKPLVHVSNAAGFGFFDGRNMKFETEKLSKMGVKETWLPEVCTGIEKLGLYRNRQVTTAIGDNQASFLGAAGKEENTLLVNMGTGGQISILSDQYFAEKGIEARPFLNGKYLLVGSSLCGGKSYALLEQFFRRVVKQPELMDYTAAAGKGYAKGSALAGKVSSLISGGGIGGMNFGNIPAGAGTAGNPAAVKGTGKNGSMNVKLEDEDIDYLRELAERDYVARIAQNTLAPNIQVTFTGDISQEMDYEKIGPAVAQILQDEIDTAPEGLY